jgi:CMP/dCMP kinase
MPEQVTEVITIDGPAGVGKSTISRKLAARLGYTYLDTGAMYRAVALYLVDRNIDFTDQDALERALSNITIELLPATDETADSDVLLNGEAVGNRIRTPEISMCASTVSALPSVRRKLTEMQQSLGRRGKVVAEGRDTGTVVFPTARHKFFLDASPLVRTRRRALQMRTRGEKVDEEALLQMTEKRDRQDRERAVAPLKKAADAHLIDTTNRSLDQVLQAILMSIYLE